LHLAIVALLIFGLPHALQKPEKDQAVDVALVPPPEPKAQPPATRAEVEKPQEKKAAAPPIAKGTPPQQPAVSNLSPVFQYGEKDSGPRKSLEGDSAAEESKSPDAQQAPDEQAATEKDATATHDSEPELSLPDAAALPTARPAESAKKPDAPKLQEAKKLFSRSATGDALAMTAMGDLPRSVRGSTLCVTELGAQLRNASPPYFADLLPSSPLGEGTVIDVPGVAFRANGQWRNLGYRCEVDADATKVVSFAFRVGELIPRNEWKRRGLSSQ
jgi:hypothetical protein